MLFLAMADLSLEFVSTDIDTISVTSDEQTVVEQECISSVVALKEEEKNGVNKNSMKEEVKKGKENTNAAKKKKEQKRLKTSRIKNSQRLEIDCVRNSLIPLY
jgi:hypothetical protein